MKKSFFILPALILSALTGFSQNGYDSIRTRNDKPGTPQSLRTPNQAPQSHVTIINSNVPPKQNVINTTSESSTQNNTNGKVTITTPPTDGNAVSKTPVTLQTKPTLDTTKKVLNNTNPIRH